jgi:integrase
VVKRLTDVAIRNLKPGEERREVPDPGQRGLYVVVHATGRKGYAVRYRHAGKTRRLVLQGGITLASARKLAADAMHEVALGRDPAAAKQDAKAKAAAAESDTLRAVCEEYFRRDGKMLRGRAEQEAALRRHVYPTLGGRQVHGITRKELIRLLDKIEDGSGVRASDLVLAYVRKIFNWFAVRDETFRSPVIKGMARGRPSERARTRVLNDDELRAVWKAATELRTPFAALLRFLLMTAARRKEAAQLPWAEIHENGDWLLPALRNKTKQDLLRPLSAAAQAALAASPRIAGCKFAFTTDGEHPLSGFSKLKKKFDVASGVTDWTLHDLRRTARSLMSRAGVPSDHAERCLGHVIGGVRGVYDRYEYSEEKKRAYDALAAQIERVVNPADNVVEMRRG